jgi:hypothetical protein
MNGVTHFSAFRNLAANGKVRQGAFDASWVFDALQSYLQIEDVVRGTDPPDFVICLHGRRIGVELTKLNPKTFAKGGHSRVAEFERWKSEVKAVQEDGRQFPGGTFR